MSGPNQHHIPRFLQRSFGAAPKGRQKEIWRHVKGQEIDLGKISETASDDHFYSDEVDAKITKAENGLAKLYHAVRVQPLGSSVDAESAAALVTHLAPRTSHIRETFADGLQTFSKGAHDVFTDPHQAGRLLGLHEDEPTEQFRKRLSEGLHRMPQIKNAGLPGPVLERVTFYVAKENFESTIGEIASTWGKLLNELDRKSVGLARDGHIRALAEMDAKPNVRRERLAAFQWTIEAAPTDGAILPDCVALAYPFAEPALPLMFAGKDIDVVVMPLTKDRLLVGRCNGIRVLPVVDFNTDAAACSQTFFLAHSDSSVFAALNPQIGTRCEGYFTGAMQEMFEALLPEPTSAPENSGAVESGLSHLPREADLQFACSIRCADFGDNEFCQRVSDSAVGVISGLAQALPLSRLDSIVFAIDFPAALRTVDRGSDDLPALEAVHSGEVGCVGRMVAVRRDGKLKACVVFNANVAACLLSEDEEARRTGIMMIVHQLSLVAMIELVDRALPGAFENPIENDLQAGLYCQVRDCLSGYVAARLSAGFGDPTEVEAYHRVSLIAALASMKADVESERLAYRYHGDLERLLEIALSATGRVLAAASDLLGVCVGAGLPLLDENGALQAALERANLPHWLPAFGRDLERFFARLGAWQTFDEFLAFNRHVERLLWSVGLFPWNSPDGGRIEVPYFTDARALLTDLFEGARV